MSHDETTIRAAQWTPDQMLSMDLNARAYGWEIGRRWTFYTGHPLPEEITSTPSNPFLDPHWRKDLA